MQSHLREVVTNRKAVSVNTALSLGEEEHCTLSKPKQVKCPGTATQLPEGGSGQGSVLRSDASVSHCVSSDYFLPTNNVCPELGKTRAI